MRKELTDGGFYFGDPSILDRLPGFVMGMLTASLSSVNSWRPMVHPV